MTSKKKSLDTTLEDEELEQKKLVEKLEKMYPKRTNSAMPPPSMTPEEQARRDKENKKRNGKG